MYDVQEEKEVEEKDKMNAQFRWRITHIRFLHNLYVGKLYIDF